MDVEIVPYSDKSFVVIGENFGRTYNNEFKALNGRFNKYLKGENGTFKAWLFSNKRLKEVQDFINSVNSTNLPTKQNINQPTKPLPKSETKNITNPLTTPSDIANKLIKSQLIDILLRNGYSTKAALNKEKVADLREAVISLLEDSPEELNNALELIGIRQRQAAERKEESRIKSKPQWEQDYIRERNRKLVMRKNYISMIQVSDVIPLEVLHAKSWRDASKTDEPYAWYVPSFDHENYSVIYGEIINIDKDFKYIDVKVLDAIDIKVSDPKNRIYDVKINVGDVLKLEANHSLNYYSDIGESVDYNHSWGHAPGVRVVFDVDDMLKREEALQLLQTYGFKDTLSIINDYM